MAINFSRKVITAAVALAVFVGAGVFSGIAHAAGNVWIDGGALGAGNFPGIASLGATPSCSDVYDLFKIFDTQSPQDGRNVVECIATGERVIGNDENNWGTETLSKPLIAIGDAVVRADGGSSVHTITMDTPTTSPIPPFIYVGDHAQAVWQGARFKTSATMPLGMGYFITFRTAANSTLTNVTFDNGGVNAALLPGSTDANPACDAALTPQQESDLQSSILNIHKDQTGHVTLDNVSFGLDGDVALAALYVAQPLALANVSVIGEPIGIVYDARTGANPTVSKTNTNISASTIANEAWITVTSASNTVGDLNPGITALSCSAVTPPPASVTKALVSVTNGAEADGGLTHPTVTVSLQDDTGAPVTASADTTFTLNFTDGTAHGGTSAATGADFNSAAGQTVTIPAGASTATVPITLFADTLFETSETFDVALTTSDTTIDVSAAHATVTITDTTTLHATLSAGTANESAGALPLQLTLTQTNATGAPLDFLVTLGAATDTATAGTDYLDNGGSVTLSVADGSDTAAYTVAVQANDGALEADEQLTATAVLASGTAAEIAARVSFDAATAQGTIHDDTPVTAALSVAQNGTEGSAEVIFNVQLSTRNMTGSPLNFTLSATGGTATADSDYSGATLGTVSVPHDASSGTATILVTDDADVEATETLTLTLAVPAGGLGTVTIDPAHATATAQIADNDTAGATIAVTTHGAEGAPPTAIVFTVTLTATNATGAPITFDLALDGTATAGTDYTDTVSGIGTVAVTSGARTATITVPVVDDSVYEGDETVRATISNPSHSSVTIGTASASATIADDDVPARTATLSATQQGAEAPPTDIVYTVTLSGPNVTGAPITFDTVFTGGTATSDDYGASVAGGKTLSIAPGATTGTLTVPVVNDSALEGEETVELTISNPSHSSVTISTARATATITDDEAAAVAAANSERDKDREHTSQKKRKKKKSAAGAVAAVVSVPARRVAQAVEPLVEERTETIAVPATPHNGVLENRGEKTITWKRATSHAPQVLGAETQAKDAPDTGRAFGDVVTRFWLLLLLLLAVLIALGTYAVLRHLREKQEHAAAHDGTTPSWWDKQ